MICARPYDESFYETVGEARRYLAKALYEDLAGHDEVIASCIGHTHIDVAWWWTVAQTQEKACRSFATVLRLMEQYPNYRFMSSQPQLYAFLKARYPELYAQIKQRIAEGRWEAEGGMWVRGRLQPDLRRKPCAAVHLWQSASSKKNSALTTASSGCPMSSATPARCPRS